MAITRYGIANRATTFGIYILTFGFWNIMTTKICHIFKFSLYILLRIKGGKGFNSTQNQAQKRTENSLPLSSPLKRVRPCSVPGTIQSEKRNSVSIIAQTSLIRQSFV